MQVKKLSGNQTRMWIGCGWRLFAKARTGWLGMALIYLVLAMVFEQIPFIGYLLLVLLTPMLVAGAIQFTAALDGDTDARDLSPEHLGWADKLKAFFGRATKQLLQIFNDPETMLSVMVVATLTLGAAVIVQILAQLLKVGGAALPALAAGSVGPQIWLPALVSLLVVSLLKLVLALIMLYAVHLVVLKQQSPLAALEHAANACLGNPMPVGGLALALVVPLIVASTIGSIGEFVIGLLVLPVLVTSAYCSYKDLYV
jgi:hypothetical protein